MDIYFKQDIMDLVFNDGDLVITSTTQEDLMQRLFTRFKTHTKDLYWQQNYGIDYLNNVFGDNRRKSSVDLIIRSEILKEELVAELMDFESSIINYSYSCKFTVRSVVEEQIITYYILTTENGVVISDENNNEMLIRI